MIEKITCDKFDSIMEDNNFITWEYITENKEGFIYDLIFYDNIKRVLVKKDFKKMLDIYNQVLYNISIIRNKK